MRCGGKGDAIPLLAFQEAPPFMAGSFTVFYLFILSGLWGSPVGNRNIAIIFVWILWWFVLKAILFLWEEGSGV